MRENAYLCALAVSGGIAIMVLGYTFAPKLLEMMGTPEEVMPDALSYIRIYFIGMIPSLIYNIGSGLLRAVGDSRRPLMFLMSACFVNIILDVIFVMGFDMGTAGAAIATALSQFVSFCILLMQCNLRKDTISIHPKHFRPTRQMYWKILYIGFPSLGRQGIASVSNILLNNTNICSQRF